MPSCDVFPSHGRLAVSLHFGVATLVSLGARASADVEPVHVVYQADPSCPDERRFVDEILSRTRRASIVGASDARRTFVVTVRARDARFVGRLEIRTATESAVPREVWGSSCPAVTSALAFVAALAIDPDLSPPAKATPPNPVEPAPAASAPAESAPVAAAPHQRWRIGVDGEGTTSIAPAIALGGQAFAELPFGSEDELPRASFGPSSARLGLHYARTGIIRRVGAAARFDWAALGLEICVVHLPFGPRADMRACGAFEAGALRGEGQEVAFPHSPLRPWLSVGPLLRFQWIFQRPWFLEAEGELVVPLRRETFVLENPPATFQEVSPLGVQTGIGIGYRLGDRGPDLRP